MDIATHPRTTIIDPAIGPGPSRAAVIPAVPLPRKAPVRYYSPSSAPPSRNMATPRLPDRRDQGSRGARPHDRAAADALPQSQRRPDDRERSRTALLDRGNLAVFSSPIGGVGTSTLMALTARALHGRSVECALFDADLTGGGLNVLLGIEGESGLTMQGLDAPLGRIDGPALNRELPHWDGIPVLAHTPWNGDMPQWWEMRAALQALCDANTVVLADAGSGDAWERLPELARAPQVVAVELSVLGMARAKAHLARLETLREETAGGHGPDMLPSSCPPLLVGVDPRAKGGRGSSSPLALAEAIAYLGDDVLGPVRWVPALASDMLDGLGIREVPKRNRKVVDTLAERVERSARAFPSDGGPGVPDWGEG